MKYKFTKKDFIYLFIILSFYLFNVYLFNWSFENECYMLKDISDLA